MKNIFKLSLKISAIILTVCGWFISQGEDSYWVRSILAPEYTVAYNTYENMIKNKGAIGEGDPGFHQIALILEEKLTGPGDLSISKIKILDSSYSFINYDTGMKGVQTITVEITVKDGRKVTADSVEDLRSEIRNRYLSPTIFKSGTIVFWLGIVLACINLFCEYVPLTLKKRLDDSINAKSPPPTAR